MKKLIIIALCFVLCGCATRKHYTMVEYYEYGKDLFWTQRSSATIGDDDKYAYMVATDMYSRQVDLEPLRKEIWKKKYGTDFDPFFGGNK